MAKGRPRLEAKEQSARIIFRALTELSNFPDFMRPQIMERVSVLLRKDNLNSVADFLSPITFDRVGGAQ